MKFNLSQFNINEKDLFVIIFGIFLAGAYIIKFPVAPFRFESLVVVFLFLLTTRSLIESNKFIAYLIIAIFGLVFSTFLSPYGLLIYFLIAIFLYKKLQLL